MIFRARVRRRNKQAGRQRAIMTAATVAQQPLPPEMKDLDTENSVMINNSISSLGLIDEQPTATYNGADEFDELAAPIDEKALLEGPYCRLLGDTEHNWCRAVSSGTGITVLSILFSKIVDSSVLQRAVISVQLQHPRLRSQLLWIQGRPAFKVTVHPCVKVEVVDATSSCSTRDILEEEAAENRGNESGNGDWCSADLQDAEGQEWMVHLETELNVNVWPEHHHDLEPVQMFVVHLYLLPGNRSLLVLRIHTAVCDRVAAATVMGDLLRTLRDIGVGDEGVASVAKEESPFQNASPDHKYNSDCASGTHSLMSVEDAIPPGKANKPFWAHGVDLLGYSLGSRRHALLPFDEPTAPRRSKFFHCTFSVEQTKLIIEACEKRNSSVYGVLCASGLKAAAAMKLLGKRSEHFAIVSLVNCRQFLQPKLSNSTVGFYHSALMNTHHVNEQTEFWELAKRTSGSVKDSLKNRKHFTDMGDLNFLMFQALQHPNLTPSSSMRTSLLVLFQDPVLDEKEDLAHTLGVEHYLGCSSIHGVGPSLAIFDSIRNGALHFTGVYATPLYSRAQMLTYVRLMVDAILQSLDN